MNDALENLQLILAFSLLGKLEQIFYLRVKFYALYYVHRLIEAGLRASDIAIGEIHFWSCFPLTELSSASTEPA